MALLKRKTRKVLLKELHRLVKKHGSGTAVGLITGMITEFIGQAVLDPSKDSKRKKKPTKKKKK